MLPPLYQVLKWLHVVAVIAVVGLHSTYGVWLVRSYRRPETLSFTLRTIRLLDDRVASPGFVTLLASGATMLAMTRTSPATSWLFVALVLFVVLTLVHLLIYRPTLRRLDLLVERGAAGTSEFRLAAKRERDVGITMIVVMLFVAFLMVVKPRV